MSDTQAEVYNIFCILQGEKLPISIKITKNQPVSELQEEIKRKKTGALAGIDANKLELYPINFPDDRHLKRMVDQILQGGSLPEMLRPSKATGPGLLRDPTPNGIGTHTYKTSRRR